MLGDVKMTIVKHEEYNGYIERVLGDVKMIIVKHEEYNWYNERVLGDVNSSRRCISLQNFSASKMALVILVYSK